MKNILNLIGIGFLTYTIFSCTNAVHNAPPPTKKQAETNRQQVLVRKLTVKSEFLIKKYLKDPDSATFSPIYETSYKTLPAGQSDDFRYFVEGWVRSTNSFGGMVRNKYQIAFNSKMQPLALGIGEQSWTWRNSQ